MSLDKKKQKSNAVENIKRLLGGLPEDHCVFCRRPDDDEELFGKKIQNGLTVHYFCMLFASGLIQRGQTDDQGIYGFMPEDIIKELRRGARLRCTYCKEKGATVGCIVSKCRHVFHFGCGLQNNTMHQYFDTFSSYCGEHRLIQKVPRDERLSEDEDVNSTCAICMTSVEMIPSIDTLRMPCCRKGWFHRECIKRHALAAGLYFFKCPLCNNKEKFQEEMLKFGIYIPDQDAAWELEPNAFNELLERYLHCDAKSCKCGDGRAYNKDGGRWEILICDWCGSKGSHVSCHGLIRISTEDYICQDCMDIHNKSTDVPTKHQKKSLKSLKTLPSPRADKKLNVLKDKSKSEYSSAEQSVRFRKSTDSTRVSLPFTSPMNMKKVSHSSLTMADRSSSTSPSPSSCDGAPLPLVTSTIPHSPIAKSRLSLNFDSHTSPLESSRSNRKVRMLKRKRKENDKIRKSLNLDIDMAWSDPDSSDSEIETRRKKLRRRGSSISAAQTIVKESQQKSRKSREAPKISPVHDTAPTISPVKGAVTERSATLGDSGPSPPVLSPQYSLMQPQKLVVSPSKSIAQVCVVDLKVTQNQQCSEKSASESRRIKLKRMNYRKRNPFLQNKFYRKSKKPFYGNQFTKIKPKFKDDEDEISEGLCNEKLVDSEKSHDFNVENCRTGKPHGSDQQTTDSDSDLPLGYLKEISSNKCHDRCLSTGADGSDVKEYSDDKKGRELCTNETVVSYEDFLKDVMQDNHRQRKDHVKHPRLKLKKSGIKSIPGQTSITKWFSKCEKSGSSSDSSSSASPTNTQNRSDVEEVSRPSQKSGEECRSLEQKGGNSPSLKLEGCKSVEQRKVLRILRKGKSYTIRRTVLKGKTFLENVDKSRVSGSVSGNYHNGTWNGKKVLDSSEKENVLVQQPNGKKIGILSQSFGQGSSANIKTTDLEGSLSPKALRCKGQLSDSPSIDPLSRSLSRSYIEISSETSSASPDPKDSPASTKSQKVRGNNSLELEEEDINVLFNTSFHRDDTRGRHVSGCITVNTDVDTDTDCSAIDTDSDSGDLDTHSSSQYIIRSFCEEEGFQELKIFVPNQV